MLLLALVLSLQFRGEDVVGQFPSDLANQHWICTVTRGALEAAPTWTESDANPPLSPRRAIAVARERLATLVPTSDRWTLSEVTLQPILGPDRWIYLVGFSEPSNSSSVAQLTTGPLRIVVLMDEFVAPMSQRPRTGQ